MSAQETLEPYKTVRSKKNGIAPINTGTTRREDKEIKPINTGIEKGLNTPDSPLVTSIVGVAFLGCIGYLFVPEVKDYVNTGVENVVVPAIKDVIAAAHANPDTVETGAKVAGGVVAVRVIGGKIFRIVRAFSTPKSRDEHGS